MPRGSVTCCTWLLSPPRLLKVMETEGLVPPVKPPPLPVMGAWTAPARVPAKRIIQPEPVGLATRALPVPMEDRDCNADCTDDLARHSRSQTYCRTALPRKVE